MKFLLTLNVNVFEALDDFIYDGDKEIFLTTMLECLLLLNISVLLAYKEVTAEFMICVP